MTLWTVPQATSTCCLSMLLALLTASSPRFSCAIQSLLPQFGLLVRAGRPHPPYQRPEIMSVVVMASSSNAFKKVDDDPSLQRNRMIALCPTCQGEGNISKPLSKKARIRHHKRTKVEDSDADDPPNERVTIPAIRWDPCRRCDQTGLIRSNSSLSISSPSSSSSSSLSSPPPFVAIVGGGLGGIALAVALQHRNIPFGIYERDTNLEQRSQGYGLTMQQARRALRSLGIDDRPIVEKNRHNASVVDTTSVSSSPPSSASFSTLQEAGITSTKHLVHTTDGTVVGEWGLRKWGRDPTKKPPKRQNMQIARQSLRRALWEALQEAVMAAQGDKTERSRDSDTDRSVFPMNWGHRLVKIDHSDEGVDKPMQLTFDLVDEHGLVHDTKRTIADVVVGCDGIRSKVRSELLGDDVSPLRYLNCVVVLGICPLRDLDKHTQRNVLLDGETVFQTADGASRIYVMPFSKTEVMWQLSFPVQDEAKAKALSGRGASALKEEAWNKCGTWHSPIPEILQTTPIDLVSGYPVYDRELITTELLQQAKARQQGLPITLLGDAAHPMSPFKGQGANQALLDALSLARSIHRTSREDGGISLIKAFLQYEEEMTTRSAAKVLASSEAARFLHSAVAIQDGNVTRGAVAAAKDVATNTSLKLLSLL